MDLLCKEILNKKMYENLCIIHLPTKSVTALQ